MPTVYNIFRKAFVLFKIKYKLLRNCGVGIKIKLTLFPDLSLKLIVELIQSFLRTLRNNLNTVPLSPNTLLFSANPLFVCLRLCG